MFKGQTLTTSLNLIWLEFLSTLKDPFEYQLAKQSIANLYPETAAEIFRLLDARNGSDFDESLPAEFSLVTADFVTFMKEMKACRRQFESIVQKLPTESGLLTIVVNKKDGERALKYRKNIEISNKLDQRKLEQRILVTECDIDLSILPTCMLRVGDDFTVSIYMASENGFIPLNSYEANRIKQQIESVQFNGITH